MSVSTVATSFIVAIAPWHSSGVVSPHEDEMEAAIHRPDGLTWKDGPPTLPAGAKFAVLEGDPTKPGPFAFRVKVPDGYRIPPHTHPKPERMTVITASAMPECRTCVSGGVPRS